MGEKEKIIEELRQLSYWERMAITTASFVDETTTYKDLMMLKSNIDNSLTKAVHVNQSDKLKPRFTNAMVHSAIVYLLEKNVTPKEVFLYIKEAFGLEDDWLRVAKHTKLKDSDKTKVANMIVNAEYEIVQELDSRGLSVKDAIITGRSPTKQINTVSDYLQLNKRVNDLENRVNEMELRQVITECRLEQLESKLVSKKDIAIKLKIEGKSTTEISEILGTPTRTIRRWINP